MLINFHKITVIIKLCCHCIVADCHFATTTDIFPLEKKSNAYEKKKLKALAEEKISFIFSLLKME